jgi:hypothetical protein
MASSQAALPASPSLEVHHLGESDTVPRREPTVHDQALAGDKRGIIGGEKEGHTGDFLRPSEAPEGLPQVL